MNPTLLIVDDDPFMHALYEDAFAESHTLLAAETADEALAQVAGQKPELIILDVELPGADGYELCKSLKAEGGCAEVPVIFVSGRDQLEDRLRGYEAGGMDYVVKPVQVEELRAKVSGLLRAEAERKTLASSAAYATSTAMTAMSSLGEMGGVIDALRKFNGSNDLAELTEAMTAALGGFGLAGAVQLRTPTETLTVSSHGPASPLEVSVISQFANLERIVQYRNKLAITYPNASMLVDNLPLDDVDRCGRYRDHLAILVEAADIRATAISTSRRANRQTDAIRHTVTRLVDALAQIDQAQRASHAGTQLALHHMHERVFSILHGIAISERDEAKIIEGVDSGVDAILSAQASQGGLQDRLSEIVGDLQQLNT